MADLQLWIEGIEPSLSVRRVSVHEQLSGLFSLAIVARSPRPDLDLDAAIFQPATFSLAAGSSGQRFYTGLCEAIEQIGAEPTGLSTYALRLVPRLHLLTLRSNHRIFQSASIPEILSQLLDAFAIDHVFRIDRAAFPKLEYKVQYGETDFTFLSRLCEDAGLTFTFADDDARGSQLVLLDAPGEAVPRRGPPLPFIDAPNEAIAAEHVTRVRLSRAGRASAVTLRDVDFRHPALVLAERAAALGPLPTLLEHHRYEPGAFRVVADAPSSTPIADALGVARHDPGVGRRLAERRLRGEQAGAFHVAFETNALDLAPGTIVAIADHPHPLLDARRRLLVTHVALEAGHGEPWRAQVQAVFADPPYQSPRVTPRPTVHGLQSAVVTGPAGRDVFTDEYGRVRVRFPWDREGTRDEQSSCWIRVSQGWAGAGYGLWTVPRVGQEVLVGFVEGNPDEPIVVGRAPNALNPPPYPLPAHATKTVWRSQSTPGAEGFNEISFEDQRGQERLYERAERDKESLVRNDERTTVGHARARRVGGEENILIGGSRREEIGGSLHQTIHAEHRAQIGGAVSSIVGGDRQEQIGGRWAVQSDGAIHLVSGQAIVIEAPDITLKGAGGFVRVGAGGVTTQGGWAEIHPGAPGTGAGSDPAVPERPAAAGGDLPLGRPRLRRLPLLGFGPVGPMALGIDLEKGLICDAMCSCKNVRDGMNGKGPNRQNCVAAKLWSFDDAMNNQSTIKAEVPYDMSQNPPAPIMSRTKPRPKRSKPGGSKIPDVVLVKDPTRPPTQDNIKKVIEMKFPGDPEDAAQIKEYKNIAGGAPVETWTLETCGCQEKEPEPVPVPVPSPAPTRQEKEPEPVPVPVPVPAPTPAPNGPPLSSTRDKVEGLLLALLILALILDDAVGGAADDVAIPALVARMLQKLGRAF
jgi:type VI secretion system secreted protein VgrG